MIDFLLTPLSGLVIDFDENKLTNTSLFSTFKNHLCIADTCLTKLVEIIHQL